MLDSTSFFHKNFQCLMKAKFFPVGLAKIPQTTKFVQTAKCNYFAVYPEPPNFLAAKLSDLIKIRQKF